MIEITNKTNKNAIIGCIYRDPLLPTNEFTEYFLQTFLEKLSYETKMLSYFNIDFNIALLHWEKDH